MTSTPERRTEWDVVVEARKHAGVERWREGIVPLSVLRCPQCGALPDDVLVERLRAVEVDDHGRHRIVEACTCGCKITREIPAGVEVLDDVNAISREVRCFRCGCVASTKTEGPSASDVHQSHRWEAAVLDVSDGARCLAAVCCWPCYWGFEGLDLWISPEQWTQARPTVPLESLPTFDHNDPRSELPCLYRWPKAAEP